MKVYTLKKHKTAEEYHLFEGEGESENEKKCTMGTHSICKKMDAAQGDESIFSCKNEKAARMKCAEEGKKVCGICVSHLYAS
jgi:hypothetical protein